MNKTTSTSMFRFNAIAFAAMIGLSGFAANNNLSAANKADSRAAFLNTSYIRPISTLPQDTISDKVFDHVDRMPSFVGGVKGLINYLSGHLKYPKIAQDCRVEGRIIVQFVVMEDGSIDRVKVVRRDIKPRSVKHFDDLDPNIPARQFTPKLDGDYLYESEYNTSVMALEDEAMRVVSTMPKWIPGEQDGKNIKVRYNVPINFSKP